MSRRAVLFLLAAAAPALAGAAEPPPAADARSAPADVVAQLERCAGFFIFGAASAARTSGVTEDAAGRVNRRRAAAHLSGAIALRERHALGEPGARAAEAAASAARAAGAYARSFGGVRPPLYLAAVKRPQMQADRRRCLALPRAARPADG
ncbi:MAG: hypothetical protein AAF676_05265 [Pseudomonadota bacterium]